MDRFTNNTIFQPIDILDGLGISTPDNKMDIALAIPGAGLDGIVPGTKFPAVCCDKTGQNFQRIYLAALRRVFSHFFELGGA